MMLCLNDRTFPSRQTKFLKRACTICNLHPCYNFYFVLQVALVLHENALVFSQSEARNSFMYIIKHLKQRQLNKVEVTKDSTRTLTAALTIEPASWTREEKYIILDVTMFFFPVNKRT